MNRSESIDKLAEALSQAQAEIEGASKDKENPHFRSRYADLASIWDACRKPLSSRGLAVIQTTEAGKDGGIVLETTLAHTSGQWITGSIPVQCNLTNPQQIGSALTYARRYGLAAIVGVCPDDDDGEAVAKEQREQRNGRQPQRPTQPSSSRPPASSPKPEQPAESWSAAAKTLCDQANADWYTHMGVQDVQPRVKGEHKELMNVHQLTNHLCSHALEKGSIKEDEVTTVKGDGEVVRDNTKVWAAVGRLHAKIPNKLRKEALAYIAGKREEAARSLDIPAYSDMTAAVSNSNSRDTSTDSPRSGKALFAWTKDQEQRHSVSLIKYINSWAKLHDFPGRMVDWDAEQVARAHAEACRKLNATSTTEAYEQALAN